MESNNKKSIEFINTLLETEDIKGLEFVEDQEVKVSTHTYDVLKISIDQILKKYLNIENAKTKLDLFAILVGVILHDVSKVSLRNNSKISHSQIMNKNPQYVASEIKRILLFVEKTSDLKLKTEIKKHIVHIVLSHHGRWGKVSPKTKEAHIVHRADMHSAKYNRINPITANQILELMVQDFSFEDIQKKMGCTEGVLKDRLKRSKKQLNLNTTNQLLAYYKKYGKVPIGDAFFSERVKSTKNLKKLVEEKGFFNLISENPLIKYLDDDIIFI